MGEVSRKEKSMSGDESHFPDFDRPSWSKSEPKVSGYYWVRGQMGATNWPWKRLLFVRCNVNHPPILLEREEKGPEIELPGPLMFAGPIKTPDDSTVTEWPMVLNKYQRDNLLTLLRMMCGWSREDLVDPFTFMNTGDWCGEIRNMLEEGPKELKPNIPIKQIRDSVEKWKKGEKHTF